MSLASFSSSSEALRLLEQPLEALMAEAAVRRDRAWGHLVSYSRKVFIPLTQLCRDTCHYCTFATTPRRIDNPYMPLEAVLEIARKGAQLGCNEALFTLGDRPEDRYRAARDALASLGFDSTLAYLEEAARQVRDETGILPHLNPGILNEADYERLRPVSASMGLMIESTSERLCQRGGPHFGSPDKLPQVRLEALEAAGRSKVPFTTGLLIGIGETRLERLETLAAIRDSHARHGHVQEVIVQNFRAKPGTKMANAPEPDLDELLWTLAAARLMMPDEVSLQAPPNLSPGQLSPLVAAGLNDWGGVSPLTPDHVNPEAAWPELATLARQTAEAGKTLVQRLTIYPRLINKLSDWADTAIAPRIRVLADADGLAREDQWTAGVSVSPPAPVLNLGSPSRAIAEVLAAVERNEVLDRDQINTLFTARAGDVDTVCAAADALRARTCGEQVSYVVTRNINYTNVCNYRCTFCAFSKGRGASSLRGKAYDLDLEEVARRTAEARDRGAVEVCMQGGIHPSYTGDTYLELLRTARDAAPGIHVHAFSPLEVTHGARSLGLSLPQYLERLKDAGLGSLPGTAAEVLHDEVRAILCPDKVSSEEWIEVMRAAHAVGLRTTSTLMFGHVDRPEHWTEHLLVLRQIQEETGGFTEFVPLPFVAPEAPLYLQGLARRGPSWREVRLVHAVARLALNPFITNIQVSWVKLGQEGASAILNGGANDLGGTLMNESITRAAGAAHGQEMSAREMEATIHRLGRTPFQRTTLYGQAPDETRARAFVNSELSPIVETPLAKRARPTVG
jgi:FO synthase